MVDKIVVQCDLVRNEEKRYCCNLNCAHYDKHLNDVKTPCVARFCPVMWRRVQCVEVSPEESEVFMSQISTTIDEETVLVQEDF